jgi:hypothetical protein
MSLRIERIDFKGWSSSYRMTNGEVDLVVTGDIGPRVINEVHERALDLSAMHALPGDAADGALADAFERRHELDEPALHRAIHRRCICVAPLHILDHFSSLDSQSGY